MDHPLPRVMGVGTQQQQDYIVLFLYSMCRYYLYILISNGYFPKIFGFDELRPYYKEQLDINMRDLKKSLK